MLVTHYRSLVSINFNQYVPKGQPEHEKITELWSNGIIDIVEGLYQYLISKEQKFVYSLCTPDEFWYSLRIKESNNKYQIKFLVYDTCCDVTEKFKIIDSFLDKHLSIVSVYLQTTDSLKIPDKIDNSVLYRGDKVIIETLVNNYTNRNLYFELYPNSFTQANTTTANVLYNSIVKQILKLEINYSDYSLVVYGRNSSPLTLFLSQLPFKRIKAFIPCVLSYENSVNNLNINGIDGIDYIHDPYKIQFCDYIQTHNKEKLLILSSPGRSGFNCSDLINSISNYSYFCYLSCNSKTLQRDLQSLNLKCIKTKTFDLFPGTKYCETFKIYFKEVTQCFPFEQSYDLNDKIKYYSERLQNKFDTVLRDSKDNFRNKVRLVLGYNPKGELTFGYNDLTKVVYTSQYLTALSPKMRLVNKKLNKCIRSLGIRTEEKLLGTLTLRETIFQNKIIMSLDLSDKLTEIIKEKIYSKILKDFEIETSDTSIVEKLFVDGKNYLFKVSMNSFFQTNIKATQLLYTKIKELVKKYLTSHQIFDLCCGTGTIGITLCDIAQNEVIGIDYNESNITDAEENIKMNVGCEGYRCICGKVEDVVPTLNFTKSIGVIDPARAGIHSSLVKFFNETTCFEYLIYISCWLPTFKRDIELLNTYEPLEYHFIDMFPQTNLGETIVVLKKLDL